MADISKIKLGSTTYNIKDANAARTSHTHTTSLATDTGTSAITLAYGGKYKLSTGGTSVIFTMPASDNTNTWRGIQNNLTSDSTTDSLSAAQGKALKTLVDGKAASGHTHATSIATSTGTNQITLAANTKYAITAGGTSYVFTTPPDNNSTYPIYYKSLDANYTTTFRTETKGNSSSGDYISTIRTDTDAIVGLPRYGAGLAFGRGDTQGYIMPGYNSASFWVGGGNADKLNWKTNLMTGISDITRSGTTFTATRLDGTTFTFTQQDNNTTYNFSGTAFTSNNSTGQDANNVTYNAHTYYTSNGPATSLGASANDGALYTQAWSATWVAQIAQDYRNGGLYVRGKKNDAWQSWYRVLDTRNTTTASIGSASGWSAGTRPSLTISSYVVGNSLNKDVSSVAGATSLTATDRTNGQSTTDYKLSIAANVTALNNSTTLGTITVGSASNWSSGTSPSLTITSVTNVRKDA